MAQPASKLIQDLTHVPNIVGALGLSIAAAQKALNADYLDSVERLLAMAKLTLGDPGADAEKFAQTFRDLLVACAPARYQYTETTLSVKLDLAQSMDATATVGLGVGFPGVSVNAAFTVGYAYDYRAAAEVKTTIHAIPADQTSLQTLLDRAKELSAKSLELPKDTPQVDKDLLEKQASIFEKIVGRKPAAVTET